MMIGAEQNFYEVLEVEPGTTLQQIERAYRIARATYQPGSTATYSLFSDEESADLVRRIEEAYVVLSDVRRRREYDARLRREGMGDQLPPAPAPEPAPATEPISRPVWTTDPEPEIEFELDEPAEPADGIYDGRVLRRIRVSRGIELDEISALTRISEMYLQFIEANRYGDLPAPVYVRGFLKQVAKCLKLDPGRVADSYMQGFKAGLRGA